MKKNRFGKSSEKHFRKILMFTSVSLFAAVCILTAVLFFLWRIQINNSIKTFESGKTAKALLRTNDYFEQITQHIFYLNDMQYTPMDQLDTNGKLWQKKVYSDNINSLGSSNPHITSISLKNNDFEVSVSYSENKSEPEYIGEYVGSQLYITKNVLTPKLMFYNFSSQKNCEIEICIDISSLSSVVLEEDCFMVNTEGTVILSQDMEKIGENIFELYSIDKKPLSESFTEVYSKNNGYYVSAQKNKESELYIIAVVPESRYASQYSTVILECILIGIIFLIFALTVAVYFINKTYAPIRKIVETFKYHLPYNMSEYEDNVEFINTSIENSIKSNKELQATLESKISELKQSQSLVLQNQISPHFVMNTLENVKQMSIDKLGLDNGIENSIVLLSSIITETIRQEDVFSTLGKEIELSKMYLSLMLYRYKNPFQVIWETDPALYDLLMVKFTFQPVLENVFSHAFNQRRTDQWIKIKVTDLSDDIKIEISNNGYPIASEKTKQLLSSLEDTDEIPRKHIGLKNIHIRIKLLFGEDYGIKDITSNEEETRITILMPKRKKT